MHVKDTNPYSKHYYGKTTEAIVTFDYKGYNVSVDTNGSGCLEFEGAKPVYQVTDAFGQTWKGTGSIADAIKFIHNNESLKD